MNVMIDKEICIACGICEGIYPEVFSIVEDKGNFYPHEKPLNEEKIKEATESCPTGAIKSDFNNKYLEMALTEVLKDDIYRSVKDLDYEDFSSLISYIIKRWFVDHKKEL